MNFLLKDVPVYIHFKKDIKCLLDCTFNWLVNWSENIHLLSHPSLLFLIYCFNSSIWREGREYNRSNSWWNLSMSFWILLLYFNRVSRWSNLAGSTIVGILSANGLTILLIQLTALILNIVVYCHQKQVKKK